MMVCIHTRSAYYHRSTMAHSSYLCVRVSCVDSTITTWRLWSKVIRHVRLRHPLVPPHAGLAVAVLQVVVDIVRWYMGLGLQLMVPSIHLKPVAVLMKVFICS